jgi:hypothetical protein
MLLLNHPLHVDVSHPTIHDRLVKASLAVEGAAERVPSSTFSELTVATILVFVLPTVTLGSAFKVVMDEALIFSGLSTVAPQVLALLARCWTVAIEAVATCSQLTKTKTSAVEAIINTRFTILHIQIWWTVAGVSSAVFRQVTVSRGMPAHGATRPDPTVIAARPDAALGVNPQSACDRRTTRVTLTVGLGAAVAVFAIVNHPVTTGAILAKL